MNVLFNTKREPFTFLFRKMWQFSASQHYRIVAYVFMFVIANSIELFEPIVFAMLLNEIQIHGVTHDNITYLLLLCSLFLVITISFWFFHGIGRVIETKNAFLVKVNYQSFLVKNALARNLPWHQAHDSGNTLDRINKSRDALHTFSASTFIIIQLGVKIIGTAIALYFLNPSIAIGVTVLIFLSFYVLRSMDF